MARDEEAVARFAKYPLDELMIERVIWNGKEFVRAALLFCCSRCPSNFKQFTELVEHYNLFHKRHYAVEDVQQVISELRRKWKEV